MMHLRNRHAALVASVLAALCISVPAHGEENLRVLNFETKVGSFKALGTDHPAHGRLTITFTGTVLLSGFTGTPKIEGNVLKEIDNPQHKKLVYHGSGKMTLDGSFNGIQFFGQKLTGRFEGVAIFRLYGEFDKDLNTGSYWYDGGDRHDWGTGGMQLPVPGYRRNGFQQSAPIPNVKVKH